MSSRWIRIDLPDGKMDAFLATPPSGKGPGVILLQEIFGVNAAIRGEVDRLAAAGFTVLAPDLFWRTEPRLDLGYVDTDRQRAFSIFQNYNPSQGADDAVAAAKALATFPESDGSVSFVGFCLGGKLAVMAGARYGTPKSVVSFYGVKLDTNLTEIDAISAPLQLHVGDQDGHVPMETTEMIRNHVKGRSNVEVFVYPGAQHAFFNPARSDAYDEAASTVARGRMLAALGTVA